MGTEAAVALTIAGVLLIATALRDIFDALFHPGGKGSLSRGVMRSVWWLAHRIGGRWPDSFSLAGPFALLSVVGTWAVLLIFGWAFVLWPHYNNGFVDALDLSIGTLTTLGLSNLAEHVGPLRIFGPLEALLGFSLLSASISWLLTVHPVLSRRRSLAYEVALLREAERRTGVPSAVAEHMYGELTSRLVAVERDFVVFPLSYYFPETDQRFSLAAAMPYLLEIAQRGESAEDRDVRLRGEMLREAIDDFASTVAERFHRERVGSTADALDAYARDHMLPARLS